MRVISHRNVMLAAQRHPRSVVSVQRWFDAISLISAPSLAALREVLPATDQVGKTLVFNIAGHRFRLLGCVDWAMQRVFFRALLTHAEYDRVQVEELCP